MEIIVSVIVPTFNKAAQLKSTLGMLLDQDVPDDTYEVLVVDNNSTDDTRSVLEEISGRHKNLRYVCETKKGPAAARNRGISESRGDLLIFIDDDMSIARDHIRMHLEFHKQLAQPLCVVGRWEDHTRYDSRILDLYFKTHLQIIPGENEIVNPGLSLASGNFSVQRSTLELVKEERAGETQYYDERLLAFEDGDLGYRMESAGVRFHYTREIRIAHCHVYSKQQIMNRDYSAGYYRYLFDLKHPDARKQRPIIIIKNKNLNRLLLLSGAAAFMTGYLIQWITPRIMLKGVGACLLYQASKGYQKAMRDFAKKNPVQSGKRVFDLILTMPAIIAFLPVYALVALCVRILVDSPVLFSQDRPGLGGKPFRLYKFRTMTDARGAGGALLSDAERLTRFGRFLRSTSLDELPELFNVLKGDMSLVGPRPLLMQYLERYSPEQGRRHHVKPGITGWAQVNGRNAITWEEKFKLDVWYVDNWSLWLDIKIIFLTIWKIFQREGINQPGQATMEEFNPKKDFR